MRKIILSFAACLALAAYGQKPVQDTRAMDTFIDQLMGKMTLDEKIGQLNLSGGGVPGILSGSEGADETIRRGWLGATGGSELETFRKLQEIAVKESRLGIPLLFGLDVIHGYHTIFPIPLALSCSWDTTLIEQSARIAAIEASSNGVTWTYSPMVDIARDARWGRIAEGSGEDPWWGGKIAAAMVRGYQGDDLTKENTILSCLKHFALYGASEAGRDYNTVDMSRIKMFNEYFPPYKAAVEAGCATVMSSFNLVEAIPATGNRWLLTDLLRDQWGFNGFVVSDYNSIGEMTNHGLGDTQTVSALALHAGLDMDMMTNGYITTLKKSLEEGRVSQADIDQACRRVLEAKYKLGLFEDPYRYLDADRAKKNTFTDEHMNTARHIAGKSIVLLKNDKGLLPLRKTGTIAVVGPLADKKVELFGTWCGIDTAKSASVVQAVKEMVGNKARVIFAKGCNLTNEPMLAKASGLKVDPVENTRLVKEAVEKVKDADRIIAVVGEPNNWSGEACSRADISLPESQKELLRALLETGKPVVLVLANGRPLTLEWEDSQFSAIVEAWHGGSAAARGLVDVLFGDVNPSGKLTTTFPRSVGQIPLYYNAKKTGRPMNPDDHFTSKYLDITNDPLYPFGYGLSYTTFSFDKMECDKNIYASGDTIEVKVQVRNTGQRTGKEVVQLYVRDLVSSVVTPVKQLKAFAKPELKPGEQKEVILKVPVSELYLIDKEGIPFLEPGEFEIQVGNASDCILQKQVIGVGDISVAAVSVSSMKQNQVKTGTGKKITVRGVVRDVQATPVEGVRIYSMGNKKELAVTNKKGEYLLKQVASDDILIFSKEGYVSKEMSVEGRSVLNVRL